jgi:hypothetical protein
MEKQQVFKEFPVQLVNGCEQWFLTSAKDSLMHWKTSSEPWHEKEPKHSGYLFKKVEGPNQDLLPSPCSTLGNGQVPRSSRTSKPQHSSFTVRWPQVLCPQWLWSLSTLRTIPFSTGGRGPEVLSTHILCPSFTKGPRVTVQQAILKG